MHAKHCATSSVGSLVPSLCPVHVYGMRVGITSGLSACGEDSYVEYLPQLLLPLLFIFY